MVVCGWEGGGAGWAWPCEEGIASDQGPRAMVVVGGGAGAVGRRRRGSSAEPAPRSSAAQLVRPSGRAAHELVRVDPALLALAAEALDILLHERLVLGEALRVERLKLRAHGLHLLEVRGFHLDPRAVLGGVEEEGADGAPGRPGGEHGGERELLARALLGAGGRGRGVGLRGRAAATAGRRVVLGASPRIFNTYNIDGVIYFCCC